MFPGQAGFNFHEFPKVNLYTKWTQQLHIQSQMDKNKGKDFSPINPIIEYRTVAFWVSIKISKKHTINLVHTALITKSGYPTCSQL